MISEGVDLLVPEDRAGKLGDMIGKNVMAGIRPEHITMKNGATPADGTTMRLPVELVEPLGSETLVHMRGSNGDMIVAKVDPEVRVASGETVDLVIQIDRLHAFDPESEAALL